SAGRSASAAGSRAGEQALAAAARTRWRRALGEALFGRQGRSQRFARQHRSRGRRRLLHGRLDRVQERGPQGRLARAHRRRGHGAVGQELRRAVRRRIHGLDGAHRRRRAGRRCHRAEDRNAGDAAGSAAARTTRAGQARGAGGRGQALAAPPRLQIARARFPPARLEIIFQDRRRSMILAFSRRAVLALAAALPLGFAAPTAFGQGARVEIAEANPELQKRADALFKGLGESGGKATYGALEAGNTPEGLLIKQIEIVSPDKKKFTIEEIEIRAFDWANPEEPRYADMTLKKFVVTADALDAEAAGNFRELGLTSLTINGALVFKFDD